MAKIPLTYTGSNTDGLYVLALRNGKEVKLRVKELDCHGGILAENIAHDNTSYKTLRELEIAETNGELISGTVYSVIGENNKTREYIYYNGALSPLAVGSDGETIISGLSFGVSYDSLEKLLEAKNNNSLSDNKIYTVTDLGTIEQYILVEGELKQIAGNLNEVTNGNQENENEVSSVEVDEDGIINYNLTELKNGNFRYKNHSTLTEVYSDMSNLTSGIQMFYGTSLTHFCGNLDSLEDGTHMFSKGCKLDKDSIYNIIDGIKTHTSGTHRIDIGYDSAEVSDDFIEEITTEFSDKNWTVIWHKDGSLMR